MSRPRRRSMRLPVLNQSPPGISFSNNLDALTRPSRLALDAAGNLYISDTGAFRLRKVDPSGIISTVAGTGSNGSSGDGNSAITAALAPGSLALDANGNRYVVDGQRVRVINAAGTINAFAGSVGSGFAGDGGAASQALLADPDGLAVDAAGNLYIADSSNDRVRKVGNNLVPVPAISSLAPSTVAAGSPPFLLTVTGSNFLPGSHDNFYLLPYIVLRYFVM